MLEATGPARSGRPDDKLRETAAMGFTSFNPSYEVAILPQAAARSRLSHRGRHLLDCVTPLATPRARNLTMPIVNRVADLHAEITAWRRDIHAHPELQYDVHRTAASVADKLKSFGCDEVVTGIGRTGVVGVIRGRKDGGKVVGLRADMDALPIEEATNLAYKSTVPGKMHACGHDGHTAMLLGAAKYLADTRNFAGTAVIDFPAAEEAAPRQGDAARRYRERSASRKCSACTIIPACRSANSPSARPDDGLDRLDPDNLEGKGTHAAFPHMGVDTVGSAHRSSTRCNRSWPAMSTRSTLP